ncbi:3842_t:CDS:2 [Cetraspora pellucida]|uniref:3842_t:CDS:1 n=1 Tax=Cetraspora pellucida TaxID=1433469 RepID=A0A9N9NEK1_9GLOM|nr:3842_t:CDS:2 [Cetraspora pellucida]
MSLCLTRLFHMKVNRCQKKFSHAPHHSEKRIGEQAEKRRKKEAEKEADEELARDILDYSNECDSECNSEYNSECDSEYDSKCDSEYECNEVESEKEVDEETIITTLTWKENEKKNPRIIRGLPKSIYYYKFGASGTLASSAKGTYKITDFLNLQGYSSVPMTFWASEFFSESTAYSSLSQVNWPSYELSASTDLASFAESDVEETFFTLDERIKQLREDLMNNERTFTVSEYNERQLAYKYLVRLGGSVEKMEASKEATHITSISPKPYTAQRIRFLAEFYLYHGSFLITQRESDANGISSSRFMQYVNNVILPKEYKKRIYVNGHEREDIVAYRRTFLEKMRILEQRMATYKGEAMVKIPPVLNRGEKELIFITHDECIFYSNDGKKKIWVPNGEMPLRKKGDRRPIMVSEFILGECGQLKLSNDEIRMHLNIPVEAHSTTYVDANGNQQAQSMVFDKDYEDLTMWGKPKRIKIILQERGLWRKRLHLECKFCKNKESRNDSLWVDCCARKVIASQPDFVVQKSAVVELIENADHLCIFYPKFHCELNFIEMYWGAAKFYARNHCDYSWAGLQKTVPQALDSVDVVTIRRFARKS